MTYPFCVEVQEDDDDDDDDGIDHDGDVIDDDSEIDELINKIPWIQQVQEVISVNSLMIYLVMYDISWYIVYLVSWICNLCSVKFISPSSIYLLGNS